MIETPDGAPRDGGMTLIEVLVAMGLFGVLASLLLGLALSTQAVTGDTRDRTGVNEEARIAMERIAREVRQSAGLDAVSLPGTPAHHTTTSFTFWTDFNNDDARTNNASDPEVMTYEWNPATARTVDDRRDRGGHRDTTGSRGQGHVLRDRAP